MKKVLALALIITFLVSCTPKNPEPVLNYRSGKEGIVIGFPKDSPPAKVYRGSKLNMVLEVRNKGAFSRVGSLGMVYLHGFDPDSIFLSNYNPTSKYWSIAIPETTAKSPYLTEGGYNLIEVPETEGVKVKYGDSTSQKIMATTCYEYQTVATPSVCVVANPTQVLKEKVCTPAPVTMTNQGAPVAVTKVEEEVMENALNFIITVQNVGDGKVINRESLANCPMQLRYEHMNIVNFQVGLSTYEAKCNPSDGKVRLIDGKGVIFCRIDVELLTSYYAPLNIILNYGYSSSVTKDVQIVNPPGSTYKPDSPTPVTQPSSTPVKDYPKDDI